MVNKIVRGVWQNSDISGGCCRLCKPVLTFSWNRVLGNTVAKITLVCLVEGRLLGYNFQVCPVICELWDSIARWLLKAVHTVCQRAYSAKPGLDLVSIFHQGHAFSGVSTSAHSCHEHHEQFQLETGFWTGRFSTAFGHVSVCVCVYPPLCLQQNMSSVFPAHTVITWFRKLSAHPLFACQTLQGVCGVWASFGTDLQA